MLSSEQILRSDIIDILFANRNKMYGAYILRKYYNHRMKIAISITLALMVIVSAITFIPQKNKKNTEPILDTRYANITPLKEPIKKEVEQPRQPFKKATAKPLKTQTWVSNVKITNNSNEATKLAKNITDYNIASNNNDINDPGTALVNEPQPTNNQGGNNKPSDTATTKSEPTGPLATAEIMPSYPGGMEALRKFLEKNLINPKEMEENEEVSVMIKFVVNYDGTLESFVTVKDGGDEFNKEVIRVLKKMPRWIPGKSNGQSVSVYYTIPVKFVGHE